MREDATMDKIQIENVRSLKCTGSVSLSPITLLLGTNSSGKSTFLRTFPLIKQSICKRTDGPLLWAGDVDDYVDFGSFSETLTNDGVSDSIKFRFSFLINCDVLSHKNYYSRLRESVIKGFSEMMESEYSITISQTGRTEYISRLEVTLGGDCFDFKFDKEHKNIGISVNSVSLIDWSGDNESIDRKTKALLSKLLGYVSFSSLESIFGYKLPELSSCPYIVELLNRVGERENLFSDYRSPKREEYYLLRNSAILITAMQHIGEFLCRGISLSDIRHTFSKNTNILDEEEANAVVEFVDELLAMPEEEKKTYSSAIKLAFFYCAFPYMESYLNVYFRQVHYIAPLRATAERYYRLRNLAIDDVDFQGKNLAIFLNGLSRDRLASFQQWTERYFGFKVLTKRGSGHLSVKVALQNSRESINLSDTGFGYSQILPIITQLWDLSSRKSWQSSIVGSNLYNNRDIPLVIAIEQPELHLHPALQSKLAKAFIASIQLANENGYQLQLLLETHSETIVNYFGRAISRKELDKTDVSIVVFNKGFNSNNTTVQITHYDEDGYLSDSAWPIGFFSSED